MSLIALVVLANNIIFAPKNQAAEKQEIPKIIEKAENILASKKRW